MPDGKVKVLIVDDSAMIRKVLSMGLTNDPDISVIGTAASADMAQRIIERRRPDVITLDMEMPHMDGLSFLRTYMGRDPIPTVVISSVTQRGQKITMEAFQAGAVDVVAKPTLGSGSGLGTMMEDITRRVKAAASARVGVPKAHPALRPAAADPAPVRRPIAPVPASAQNWLIAIGASTGGVQALSDVLSELPVTTPGIVIVQHMPEGFTRSFAQRLDSFCKMKVKEAEHGDVIQSGTVYIAPGGDKHMVVKRHSTGMVIQMEEGEPVCFSRPSVDVLFDSVARATIGKCTGVILTGMGKDGARGLKAIRDTGGVTMAQNEQSCVVFGMPHAAQAIGATDDMVALNEFPQKIVGSIGQRPVRSRQQSATPSGRFGHSR